MNMLKWLQVHIQHIKKSGCGSERLVLNHFPALEQQKDVSDLNVLEERLLSVKEWLSGPFSSLWLQAL